MRFDGLMPWVVFVLCAPLIVLIACGVYLYLQLKDC